MRDLVVVESPFAGMPKDTPETWHEYLRRCFEHSLSLGELPVASHAVWPQWWMDKPDGLERERGIQYAIDLQPHARRMAVYVDYGVSPGMQRAIDAWVNRYGGTEVSLYRRSIGKLGEKSFFLGLFARSA